jgi:hypothetical protein
MPLSLDLRPLTSPATPTLASAEGEVSASNTASFATTLVPLGPSRGVESESGGQSFAGETRLVNMDTHDTEGEVHVAIEGEEQKQTVSSIDLSNIGSRVRGLMGLKPSTTGPSSSAAIRASSGSRRRGTEGDGGEEWGAETDYVRYKVRIYGRSRFRTVHIMKFIQFSTRWMHFFTSNVYLFLS